MQEKTKTTAQVLVDCLEAEGVDVMFGIPGARPCRRCRYGTG